MSRKLYALFILIGAIWAMMLVYLYFFVYYTATIVVESNVWGYTVELFAKSTAQTITQECPEESCIITDVSPFQYNVTVYKDDYKTEIFEAKISPRKKQSFFIELEKKTKLELIEIVEVEETPKQKIQRLREQSLYYASFSLGEESKITFDELPDQVEMFYKTPENSRSIYKFPKVPANSIHAEFIPDTTEIFLKFGNSAYIYHRNLGKIFPLPYKIPVLYVKPALWDSLYIVVTQKGSFIYDILDETSKFQYLFRDFVYHEDGIIGVIYEDEQQKKDNFDLEEKGHLIIKYTPDNKLRKILIQDTKKITRIEWRGEDIIFTSGQREYKLENF